MPRLVLHLTNRPPTEIPIHEGRSRIGRATDCEVRVDDEGISRNHATITSDNGRWVLEDAGSRNGTFVNDESIQRRALQNGDRIRVGARAELEFFVDEGEGEEEEQAEEAGPIQRRSVSRGSFFRQTHCWLVPGDGRLRDESTELTGLVTTVGRDPGAGLTLEDDSVSKMHARLDREGETLVVTDLKSRNGTFVNDEQVLRAEIGDGDRVRFGDVEFEFVTESSPAWGRIVGLAAVAVALVGVVIGINFVGERLNEQRVIEQGKQRARLQVLRSMVNGIEAYRRGEIDAAHDYLAYAGDVIMLAGLAPSGATMARPAEVFRTVARDLKPEYRGFDFSRPFDQKELAELPGRIASLPNDKYVEYQVRHIARQLGQDENVPPGFVTQVQQFVNDIVRHPGNFTATYRRSQALQPRLRQILTEAHIPEAFAYEAWIESGLNPEATSPVGARGLWQFMVPTAREYHLIVGGGIDERTDVEKSTRAFTGYIGNLLRRLGPEQFMLALASYNRGEGAVIRAMLKIEDPMMPSAKRYWHLVERGLLPRETSEYVPKIFAWQIVAEQPGRFLSDFQ